jgi:hypothetical protein
MSRLRRRRAAAGAPSPTPVVPTTIADIPEARQRAIFTAVGEARAAGQAPEVARYAVAKKFVLTILKVEAIEQEGLARRWSAW